MRWLHGQSSESPAEWTTTLGWTSVRNSGRWTHDFVYHHDDTGTTALDRWNALCRIYCHALLDRIPDSGLGEVIESLKSAYEFNSLPQASPKLLVARRVPARRGRTLPQPRFSVSHDEY